MAYQVFELYHPDDPRLPRYVGCAPVGRMPCWAELWQRRDTDESRESHWFRELALQGLRPAARSVLGSPVPADAAERLVRERVKQVCRWAYPSDYPAHPEWLLNPRQESPSCIARSRPVVRIWESTGLVESFRTTTAAALATCVSRRAIRRCLATGCPDRDGCRWYDGYAGCNELEACADFADFAWMFR